MLTWELKSLLTVIPVRKSWEESRGGDRRKPSHHRGRSFCSGTCSCICYFGGNKFNIWLLKLAQNSLLCENSLNNVTHFIVKGRAETVARFHHLRKMSSELHSRKHQLVKQHPVCFSSSCNSKHVALLLSLEKQMART